MDPVRSAEERAERAELALKRLTDLTLALSGTASVHEIAELIVDHGMRNANADTATLHVYDEVSHKLVLIAHRGVAPEIVERIRIIGDSEGDPELFASFVAQRPTWNETARGYAAKYPSLADAEATGPRAKAFWSMPLVAEGRAIGLLGVGYYEEQTFSEGERSLVDTFAKQCAQALVRAQHRENEMATRQWLATTLESIGDAVIATDLFGRITFLNAVAAGLTGWTQDEARGKKLERVFDILSEETRATVESPVRRVLREGSIVGLANHTLLRSKSGKEIPIDDSAAPIRDAEGNVSGVVLVFRDAAHEKQETARRDFLARAGVALSTSLDYRATLAAVTRLAVPRLADWCTIDIVEPGQTAPKQLALAHVDPSKVEWARKLAERYPPDPNAPRGAANVIRTGKSELYPEIPRPLLEAGAQDEEHLRIIRELRLHSAMVVPLRGREETLGAMTFIYADSGRHYTEDDVAFAEEFARRAAMAIENARALHRADEAHAREHVLRTQAEIANRAKDEFLATVSHELRTPLNAILGWTVILREKKPSQEIEQGLAVIERNARRQARLIEDILDVSRIISGKMSLTLRQTRLAEIIDAAIEAVNPAAQGKGVELEVDVDIDATLNADGDRLQQVLWNLLSNAVKFTPKGGHVALRAYPDGTDICISVTDTGEGIPEKTLPHVFERFHQADASTTRKHGGLGLGLAIVKQLVTAHGGSVHVKSEGEGKGATFVVRLPSRMVTAMRPSEPPSEELLAFQAPVAPRLDGIFVLVVDDELDARQVVRELLASQGATVAAVGSARDALEVVAKSPPDVIVSDVGMPERDGYAFVRALRALPLHRGGKIPAIALTAYATREDAGRALDAGFQAHAAKPVDPTWLCTLVKNIWKEKKRLAGA